MVAQSRMYYVNPFVVIKGMMQKDPLTSTILNIMVDVVIPLWDTVVAVDAAVLEGILRTVQTLYALFWADDGLLASQTHIRIQAALGVLKGLFDHVGIEKMLSIWWAWHAYSDSRPEAFHRSFTRGGWPGPPIDIGDDPIHVKNLKFYITVWPGASPVLWWWFTETLVK